MKTEKLDKAMNDEPKKEEPQKKESQKNEPKKDDSSDNGKAQGQPEVSDQTKKVDAMCAEIEEMIREGKSDVDTRS